MRSALLLALVGTLGISADFDWPAFREQAAKARTAEAAAALEAAMPGPDDRDGWDSEFRYVVRAWQRAGRPGDAVRVVEVWRKEAGPIESLRHMTDRALAAESAYADALAYAGRLDDALASATRLRDRATDPGFVSSVQDGPNWTQVAYETLGRVHERRGEYRDAIVWYEKWRGFSAWDRHGPLVQRGTCIARCRWRLGQVDEAVDLAFDTAMSPFEIVLTDDPFVLACEIAVRSGNLGNLRRRIDGVSDPQKRQLFERSFAVATAFAARNDKAMLDAVPFPTHPPDALLFLRPHEGAFIAKYLREIGPDAVGELVARVRRGDERAIEVAVRGYVPEALPALRARRDADGITADERKRLDDAIERIESTVPPR